MADPQMREQLHRARGQFAAMAATYGLGVFNDSLFRQSAMLLAVFSTGKEQNYLQNWVMALFTLPFILFAWSSGWIADRFAKRHVVIGAKFLEVAAMLVGAWGIITLKPDVADTLAGWNLIMPMVFLMAWQSCIFGPALNGSIPELYPEAYVIKANATLKVATTAAILGGISLAGLVLKVQGTGWGGAPIRQLLAGGGVVAVAALGVVTSFWVPRRRAADPAAKFPWDGPLTTFRCLRDIWRDRMLRLVTLADVFIWFVGTVLVQVINLLVKQLGRDTDMVSYLLGTWVIGVAVGGILGSRVAVGKRWYRGLAPCSVGMGVLLALVALVPFAPLAVRLPAIFLLLGLIALLGGMVMIPCEGFVQTRPAADRKGAVIATVNFCVFGGMLVSCGVAYLLDLWLRATTSFAVVGILAVPMGLWMKRAFAKEERR